MSKCEKCGNNIGFFGALSSVACEECGKTYCKKCSDKVEECSGCGGKYDKDCIAKDKHECSDSEGVSEESDGEESDEGSDESEEESSDEEKTEDVEDKEIDLKQLEEDETLVYTANRKWACFDSSTLETVQEDIEVLDKLTEQGYSLYCVRESHMYFNKKE